MTPAYGAAIEQAEDNERYLRDLGGQMERMASVYFAEIAPFREETGPRRAAYALPVGRRAQLDVDGEAFIPLSPGDLAEIND